MPNTSERFAQRDRASEPRGAAAATPDGAPVPKLQKKVGSGAYGFVCSADDVNVKPAKAVAIKKVAKAFEDMVDAKRILREIKLLRHLGQHENVISLVDVSVMPSRTSDFKDVYIVTELMECDLDRIISSTQPLSELRSVGVDATYVASHSASISSCGCQRWKLALQLRLELRSMGIEANVVSY